MIPIIAILGLLVGIATGWFVGGLLTSIIYADDGAPVDHKICWTICGIGFGLFTMMCLFLSQYNAM